MLLYIMPGILHGAGGCFNAIILKRPLTVEARGLQGLVINLLALLHQPVVNTPSVWVKT